MKPTPSKSRYIGFRVVHIALRYVGSTNADFSDLTWFYDSVKIGSIKHDRQQSSYISTLTGIDRSKWRLQHSAQLQQFQASSPQREGLTSFGGKPLSWRRPPTRKHQTPSRVSRVLRKPGEKNNF